MDIVPLVLIFILNIVDIILTWKVLKAGHREGNPVGRFLIGKLGYWGASSIKVLVVTVLISILYVNEATVGAWIVAGILLFACIWALYVLKSD